MARWAKNAHDEHVARAGPIKMIVFPRSRNGWWRIYVKDSKPGARKACRTLYQAIRECEQQASDLLISWHGELGEPWDLQIQRD